MSLVPLSHPERFVIYARYSSENQSEHSNEDQIRLCRQRIDPLAGMVTDIYPDYAISGSHMKTRPQMQRLLADAKLHKFDVVFAESLDRLSRDQEDMAGLYKRLSFLGIRIVTVAEGEVGELQIGFKGTMNALFLRDLAQKIRRGQTGRAIAGSSPGGLSYGYNVVREFDAGGELVRGKREINPDQAEVVRRIFRDYVAGISPRMIATALNREGVPAPFGGKWNASTINGNRARRNGILHNESYIGFLIYNRTRFDKDPDTGKRISRIRPHSEWIVTEVPHLRIISDDLWDATRERKSHWAAKPLHIQRRPKHLFSGLVFCGQCGASYTIKSKDQLACAAHREKGTCDNGRTIRMPDLESRVLADIKSELLEEDALRTFLDEFNAERKRLQKEICKRHAELATKVAKLTQQAENIIDAIADGIATGSMKTRLVGIEDERDRLVSELANAPPEPTLELHPRAIEFYRQRIALLGTTLAELDEAAAAEVAALIRPLIQRLEIHPLPERGEVKVRVLGLIEQFLGTTELTGIPRTAKVVAEEGLEPPTRGL